MRSVRIDIRTYIWAIRFPSVFAASICILHCYTEESKKQGKALQTIPTYIEPKVPFHGVALQKAVEMQNAV